MAFVAGVISGVVGCVGVDLLFEKSECDWSGLSDDSSEGWPVENMEELRESIGGDGWMDFGWN